MKHTMLSRSRGMIVLGDGGSAPGHSGRPPRRVQRPGAVVGNHNDKDPDMKKVPESRLGREVLG